MISTHPHLERIKKKAVYKRGGGFFHSWAVIVVLMLVIVCELRAQVLHKENTPHIRLGEALQSGHAGVYYSFLNIPVKEGWNLISLPLMPTDPRKIAVFPTALSNAFAYDGGYVVRETLRAGVGYWIKFSAAETIAIAGQEVCVDTLDIHSRWNIIGTPTLPLTVDSVTTLPPNIITSGFYKFDPVGGYSNADTLVPGRGYWVKASQAGKLIEYTDPYANDTGWTTPKQLSFDTLSVAWPQILANGDKMFVLWQRGDFRGLGVSYVISNDDGCSWTEPHTLIPATSDNNTSVVNAASSGDWIYVVWGRNRPDLSTEVLFQRSSDFGRTWFSVQPLVVGGGYKVAAIQNKVFINFIDSLGQSSMFSSSDNGSSFVLSSPLPPIMTYYAFRGFVATPSGLHGTTSQLYDSSSSSETFYYHSSDFGLTWDSPKILSTPDNYNSNVFDLTYTGDSTIYVFWLEGKYGGFWFTGTVVMRKSTDGGSTFDAEKIISPNVAVRHSVAARDSFLFVAWGTDEDGGGRYSHIYYSLSHDFGVTFDSVLRVEQNFYYSDFPDVVLGTYLNIVGAERSSDGAPFRIYYTQRRKW